MPTLRGLKVIEDAAGNPVTPELVPWTAVTKTDLDLWGMDLGASAFGLPRYGRRFTLDGTYASIVALRAQRRALKNSLLDGSLRVEETFETLRYARWLPPLYSVGFVYYVAQFLFRPRRIGFFDVPPEYLPVAWSLAVLLLGAVVFGGWAVIWASVFHFTAPFVRRATITSNGISAELADGTKRQEDWSGLKDIRRRFDLRFANGSRLVCLVRNRRQRLLFRLVLDHCASGKRGIETERATRGELHSLRRTEAWLGDCEIADRPQLAPIHAKRKTTFPWLVPIGVISAAMVWHFGRLDPPLNENPVARALLAAIILGGCIAIAVAERNKEQAAARRINRWRIAHRKGRARRRGAAKLSRSD